MVPEILLLVQRRNPATFGETHFLFLTLEGWYINSILLTYPEAVNVLDSKSDKSADKGAQKNHSI